LDDDTFVKYRDPDELSKYVRGRIVNNEMYYILIDEVQYAITKDELKNSENIGLYNVLNGLMRLSKSITPLWAGINPTYMKNMLYTVVCRLF